MKDNRKNRKLIYIRTKNGLRSGKRRYYWRTKVHQELFDDVELDWNIFITRAQRDLVRHYKLELRHGRIDAAGLDGDDFIHNLMTIRVILHN